MIRPHTKLQLWQEAMRLVEDISALTDAFPKTEVYGLVSQMRRAGVSVPSNIAEGAARGTKKEFVQSLMIARGSLSELDTQLELAQRLGYLTGEESARKRLDDVFGLLNGLVNSLKRSITN